ncbi:hypothetical protein DIPPA_31351 [Diplonema papillatum]|nr:hypothetical protein DIPPA_31351 [Diplonema papillatum]
MPGNEVSVLPPKSHAAGESGLCVPVNRFPKLPVLSDESVSLGDGYLMTTNEVIPRQLRSANAKPAEAVCASTEYELVHQTDRFQAASKLDVTAELKLAVLCGLLKVNGTGQYLKTEAKTRDRLSFTFVAKVRSRTEQLSFDGSACGDRNDWDKKLIGDLLDKRAITHVVGKVIYGANAVLEMSMETDSKDAESAVRGSLGVKLKASILASIEGKGNLAVSENDAKLFSRLAVSLKCDVLALDELPTSFESGVKAFGKIMTKLNDAASHRVVHFQLFPVSSIMYREDIVCKEIQELHVDRCMRRMRDLDEMQRDVRETIASQETLRPRFPHHVAKLEKLARLLDCEALAFTAAVRWALVQARTSDESLEEIVNARAPPSFPWHLARRVTRVLKAEGVVFLNLIRVLEVGGISRVFAQQHHADPADPADPVPTDPPQGRLSLVVGKQVYSPSHMFLSDDERPDYDEECEEWALGEGEVNTDEIVYAAARTFAEFARRNAGAAGVEYTAKVDPRKDVAAALYHYPSPLSNASKRFAIPRGVSAVAVRAPAFDRVVFKTPAAAAEHSFARGSDAKICCAEDNSEWAVQAIHQASDRVVVKNPAAAGEHSFVRGYDAKICCAEDNSERTIEAVPPGSEAAHDGASPETKYSVRLRAKTELGDAEWGPPTFITTPPAPGPCCAIAQLVGDQVCRVEGKPPFFQLPLTETERLSEPETDETAACHVVFKTVTLPRSVTTKPSDDLVMLLIGATGVGKSTQLNALVNYLLGVQHDCQHRYVLVADPPDPSAQHQSVTSEVTVYTIPYYIGNRLHRTVRLVDCPGSNDTRGEKYQSGWMLNMFRTLYAHQPVLHCVAFLTLAGDVRLTATQKYVIGEATKVFGSGIRDNFVVIFTKSDGGKPNAKLIEEELREMKVSIDESREVVTHNVAFAMIDSDARSARQFFDVATNATKVVFQVAASLPAVSTEESSTVVQRRIDLIDVLRNLERTLDETLRQTNTLLQHFTIIKDADPKSPQQKEVTTERAERVPINHVTTTCYTCFTTCHEVCSLGPADEKSRCAVMTAGRCTVCRKKCPPSHHDNTDFKVVYTTVTVMEDDSELMGKYADSVTKHMLKEKAIANLLEEYLAQMRETDDVVERMHTAHTELGKIALNPSILTPQEFLKQLEKQLLADKKVGYQQKVTQLQSLGKQQEYAERVRLAPCWQPDDTEGIARMKHYLESAVSELNEMASLSVKEFGARRNEKKKYPWCDKPVKWSEAVSTMMTGLEELIAAANGVHNVTPKAKTGKSSTCVLC